MTCAYLKNFCHIFVKSSLSLVLFLTLFLNSSPLSAQIPLQPFISSWNIVCEKLNAPQHFYLVGDRAISAEAVISSLNQLCNIFSPKNNLGCVDDLTKLADEMSKSTFLTYANFRQKHWQDYNIRLSPEMNSQELAKALNSYIGVSINGRHPDYVSRETVETIILMNSFCAFFEARRKKLIRQGIDADIKICQGLTTNGKYPCLDSWIK